MKKSRLIAAMAFGAVAAVLMASGAFATSYYSLRYQGTIVSGQVYDTSSTTNNGNIALLNSGTLTSVIDPGTTDPYLHFSGSECTMAPCQQIMVTPTISSTLVANSAGAGTFAFGATVRIHTGFASLNAGMNVFQYGSAVTGASQWKLQADYLHPSCRFSDGTNVALVAASTYLLPDNTWVKMKCSRLSSNTFELRVTDPVSGTLLTPVVTITQTMGAIVPTGSPEIGAKAENTLKVDKDLDQFHGDMDEIFFHRD